MLLIVLLLHTSIAFGQEISKVVILSIDWEVRRKYPITQLNMNKLYEVRCEYSDNELRDYFEDIDELNDFFTNATMLNDTTRLKSNRVPITSRIIIYFERRKKQIIDIDYRGNLYYRGNWYKSNLAFYCNLMTIIPYSYCKNKSTTICGS